MNIGIIGTNIGQMHANIFKSIPGVNLVGIAGRDLKKTKELTDKLQTEAFSNAKELIGLKELDAVVICLPTNLHKEYIIAALRADKHVFCETPLIFERSEADEIAIEAQKSGKKLMVALFNRFNATYRAIYDYIQTGKLGKIRSVYANRRSPDYFKSQDLILNLMIHEFDYIRWMLGRPKSVYCKGFQSPDGIQHHAFAMLDMDETQVVLEGSTCMPNTFPFSTSLQIVGEMGSLDLNWYWGDNRPVSEVKYYPKEEKFELLSIQDQDPYEAECKYFVDCLNGMNDGKLLDFESSLDSVKMAITARDSYLNGGIREIIY